MGMVYKSKELIEEEQAIVEEALNSLVDEKPKKNKLKYDKKELAKKIKQLKEKLKNKE